MSVNIGGKVYRNLQEQVGYLTEELENLKNYVDGLELKDKLVIIENTSGTLSDEEMKVVLMPLCFMATANELFVKAESNASEVIFKKVDLEVDEVSATYFNIGGKKITVDIATKDYVTASETKISVYSKSEMDALLGAKANLAGAEFTGPVVAQTLSQTQPNWEQDVISLLNPLIFKDASSLYAKLVLLGNELSLVISGRFVAKADANTYKSIFANVTLNIPDEIASKIYRADGTSLIESSSGGTFGNYVLVERYSFLNPTVGSASYIMSSNTAKSISLTCYGYGATTEDAECYIDLRVQLLII